MEVFLRDRRIIILKSLTKLLLPFCYSTMWSCIFENFRLDIFFPGIFVILQSHNRLLYVIYGGSSTGRSAVRNDFVSYSVHCIVYSAKMRMISNSRQSEPVVADIKIQCCQIYLKYIRKCHKLNLINSIRLSRTSS